MPNYFYDASALVKQYHIEPGSSIISPLFDGQARHFISELTVVEIHAAFSKKRLTTEIATDEALRRVRAQFSNDIKSRKLAVVQVRSTHYRETERLVRQYGTEVGTGIIRSLDALQLAVALDFQTRTEIGAFLSSDHRQCRVASAEGLKVINPELQESKKYLPLPIEFAERFVRNETQQQWNAAEPDTYELRSDLLAAFRYAFRNTPDILNRVSDITDGRGHADMIQDLADITALGRRNPGPLNAIGFDTGQLDVAATRANDLAILLADRESDSDDNAARKIRDQAFTHLKEAVDEIRECGRYVFRKDPDRLEAYASEYMRDHRTQPSPPDAAPAS